MDINVYLSGEIHSDWRKEIIKLCKKEKLKITFTSPVTNHNLSDNVVLLFLVTKIINFGMIIRVLK